MNTLHPLKHVEAGVLAVAYHEAGPPDGPPVFLMHGFPYDIHAYAEVAPRLAQAGCRVFVPYLRGYGPTRFLHATTPRSGEQAALGADLLALMDALATPRAVLAGYDWGGRACCIVAALWPQRCRGLVRSTATTSSITRARWNRTRRKTSAGSGTSTTSIRNAGARAAPRPARLRSPALAQLVAWLGLRRRHVRALGRGLR